MRREEAVRLHALYVSTDKSRTGRTFLLGATTSRLETLEGNFNIRYWRGHYRGS